MDRKRWRKTMPPPLNGITYGPITWFLVLIGFLLVILSSGGGNLKHWMLDLMGP